MSAVRRIAKRQSRNVLSDTQAILKSPGIMAKGLARLAFQRLGMNCSICWSSACSTDDLGSAGNSPLKRDGVKGASSDTACRFLGKSGWTASPGAVTGGKLDGLDC